MLTGLWTIGIIVAAIWGYWDPRIAWTGWIVGFVVDFIIMCTAHASNEDEGY